MNGIELTDKQAKFLELIFLPEYSGKDKQAALDAGYSENCNVYNIYQSVKKELIEKSDYMLARLLPKSFNNLEDVMDNPAQKGAKARLEAITTVLDRVGIAKRDRIEIEVKQISGIFMLPVKDAQ